MNSCTLPSEEGNVIQNPLGYKSCEPLSCPPSHVLAGKKCAPENGLGAEIKIVSTAVTYHLSNLWNCVAGLKYAPENGLGAEIKF